MSKKNNNSKKQDYQDYHIWIKFGNWVGAAIKRWWHPLPFLALVIALVWIAAS